MLIMNFRIRDVQDMPISQHRTVQGREPSLVCDSFSLLYMNSVLILCQLHYLQLVRFSSFGPGYQDRFLCPSRKEKEDEGLNFLVFELSSLLTLIFQFLSALSRERVPRHYWGHFRLSSKLLGLGGWPWDTIV